MRGSEIMRAAIVLVLLSVTVREAEAVDPRAKRQVTYHADGNQTSEEANTHSVRPVTSKPLPAQVVYPGDLSVFLTTVSPSGNNYITPTDKPHIRRKRGGYVRDRTEEAGHAKFNRIRGNAPSESRLHASYHKPSVSVMNDIPVEMSFDGAGFLRHEEDESDEERPAKFGNTALRTGKVVQDGNKALTDFRAAFNVTRGRPDPVKFDDEESYPNESPLAKMQDKVLDFDARGAENGSPFAVDFMAAYQNAMLGNTQANFGSQMPTNQQPTFNPFFLNYPNMFNPQPDTTQQTQPTISQQESFLQNHRIQPPNSAVDHSTAMFSALQQQTFGSAPMYLPNLNPQQQRKSQRRKRSTGHKNDKSSDSKSESTEDNYKYTSREDHQDSSSAFIPINFDGGTIHLNLPFFGQGHVTSQNYHQPRHQGYSSPIDADARHFSGPSERFYHPSEARRYSYGILGSGNFEIVKGGVFPGQRQQSFRNNHHDGGRNSHRGNDYGNFGTTEIIIDGPIQGFQGFDNFPISLINALSKHSEISLHPDNRKHDAP